MMVKRVLAITLLSATAAFRPLTLDGAPSTPDSRLVAPPVTRVVAPAPVDENCGHCSSSLTENGSQSTASFTMAGEPFCGPAGGPGCAYCTPACPSSGSIGPTLLATVLAWYEWNSCTANACGDQEPGGAPEPAAFEAALELPAGVQATRFEQLIRESGGKARLNDARNAIQLFGCFDGVVVAQIDIDRTVVGALRARLSAADAP